MHKSFGKTPTGITLVGLVLHLLCLGILPLSPPPRSQARRRRLHHRALKDDSRQSSHLSDVAVVRTEEVVASG